MKATLFVRRREHQRPGAFAELVVWQLPRRLPGSEHRHKYRLARIDQEICVLRCDNETGKGDHRHYGNRETAYRFTSIEQLLRDFDADVRRYLDEHPHHR